MNKFLSFFLFVFVVAFAKELVLFNGELLYFIIFTIAFTLFYAYGLDFVASWTRGRQDIITQNVRMALICEMKDLELLFIADFLHSRLRKGWLGLFGGFLNAVDNASRFYFDALRARITFVAVENGGIIVTRALEAELVQADSVTFLVNEVTKD